MLGLRSRVTVSFAVLSLLVSSVVSGSVYALASTNLLAQRESAALTRALLDARAVWGAMAAGAAPGEALAAVPTVGESQTLARVDGTWFTRGVTVSPQDLPMSLLTQAESSGAAKQRFEVDNNPVFAVAVADRGDLYLELFPLGDLNTALRWAGWLLAGLVLLATTAGALIGRYAGARLMRPLQLMGEGAGRIADGDLAVRLHATGDPDLDPLSSAFNDMADAVEQRIARERRFVANVGHELRSPVTTVLGTAELLDAHREQLGPRDAALVNGLVGQARRLSQTLVDLLELGSTTAASPVQFDATDIAGLIEALLRARGLAPELLRGDRPVVRTDARRVERVVGNFLDNAERHGGGVRQVLIEREPEAVVVCVDDAGPGIRPEEIARLFEPFVRGTHTGTGRDGAGLGLAIAQEHGAAIGAQLSAGASPLGGARFTFRLGVGST